MNTNIQQLISAMSTDEIRTRLASYMEADETLAPHTVAIQVRRRDRMDKSGLYQVLLIGHDGSETEVKFRDRTSRLVYIYTLLHPQGYYRRHLTEHHYQALCSLYSQLYFRTPEPLLKTIGDNFNHFFSQAVAQSRKAIQNANIHATNCLIASPMHYNGRTLIPMALNKREAIIIDESLNHNMYE